MVAFKVLHLGSYAPMPAPSPPFKIILDGNDPNFLPTTQWTLHHDNAPAHTALSVREFLATKQITVLKHLAYSPDLAPNDFFFVPEDKGNIERKTF